MVKMLLWLFPYFIAVEIPSLHTARCCCPQLYSIWTHELCPHFSQAGTHKLLARADGVSS